jgi:hypothetical protein
MVKIPPIRGGEPVQILNISVVGVIVAVTVVAQVQLHFGAVLVVGVKKSLHPIKS